MAFQFPWTNFHELNLDWFLSKFKQFTNNYLGTTATAESVPYGTQPSVTVTGGELDDDTDIVDPFTFNFKIPAGQPGAKGDTGYPTDAQVTTAVDNWLDDNVTQEAGYVLDRTLSMSNAAAPADLVGELKSDFDDTLDIFDITRGWAKGSYNVLTGQQATINTYIRNNGKYGVCSGVKFVKCNNSYRFTVYAYDFNGIYIGGYKTDGTFSNTTGNTALNTSFSCADYPQYVFAFAMRREPTSEDITVDEHTNLIFSGISKSGSQWLGKFAMFYGTSLTKRNNNYWSCAARKIGLVALDKGINAQGIGNFGATSTGRVYDAICNDTDGKTLADLIVLETGANDVNADVPLGTIYDTGRTTSLAGCLNDCIRYLQQNTNAMVVVMPSTASTTEPNATDKVWEWKRMIKEICFINCVPCIECDNNLGYGKITSAVGSDYVVDAIHPTALGAQQSGETFYLKLCNVPTMLTA